MQRDSFSRRAQASIMWPSFKVSGGKDQMPLKTRLICALAGTLLLVGLFAAPTPAHLLAQDDKGGKAKKKDGDKVNRTQCTVLPFASQPYSTGSLFV